jgi:integrase
MPYPARRGHLTLAPPALSIAGHQPTVGEYLEEWLWGKQSLRPSTHMSYETHVRRYLTPHLGSLPIASLRAVHIEGMYRQLSQGDSTLPQRSLSVATLRRIHATLRSALNTAVKRGLIERNPASTVELPRVHTTRTQTWSAGQLGQFLEAIHEDRLHLLYLLLGFVGLRRGEVVALRWIDVNLNMGILRIENSAVKVGNRSVVGPPKSSSGARVVAIDDETARRLHWHQCRQRLEMLRTIGQTTTPELVFTTPSGAALDPAYVSRHFDRLITTHDMPRIRLHDLRHTSASIGLAAGESLVEVSRRLGHSSISITADIYSHISPEVAKESAERLAQTVYRCMSGDR